MNNAAKAEEFNAAERRRVEGNISIAEAWLTGDARIETDCCIYCGGRVSISHRAHFRHEKDGMTSSYEGVSATCQNESGACGKVCALGTTGGHYYLGDLEVPIVPKISIKRDLPPLLTEQQRERLRERLVQLREQLAAIT